jgi:heptosyltransferase-2
MKILVRATNWVGDAIMALPALRAVRKRFAEAEITILAKPYVAEIYQDQGVCDDQILVGETASSAPELRERGFDVALLLQNAFAAAWLAWRAGIPERIGYARDGRGALLTKAVKPPKRGETPAHEQFYYLELLKRIGWVESAAGEELISLRVPDAKQKRSAQFLSEQGARIGKLRVAIGAGASYGSAKCWLPDRFADVATRLQSEMDADVILFGTAGEAEVSAAIKSGMCRPPIDLTGRTAIGDLPALLAECDLFIGNDSGAMHVAAAVGLPVVAVFGPTDPFGTAPVTPRHSILRDQPYCSPCFLRRCPTDHRCMKRVTPDLVAAAARQWITPSEVRPV